MKTTTNHRRAHSPEHPVHAHTTSAPITRMTPRATPPPPRRDTPPTLPAPAEHTRDAQAALAARPVPPRAPFFRSFVYAGRGLWYALRTQRNARVHAVLALAAIALGLALRISPVEFAIVFVAITLVFAAEMFNTVAEACVDLATQEYHPLARIAKDVAAGAVLLCAILAVVIALLVYVPHLWPLFAR